MSRVHRLTPATLAFAACLSGGPASAPTPGEITAAEVPVPGPAAPVASAAKSRSVLDRTAVVCARAVKCGTIGRSQLEECHKGPAASRLTLVWGYDERLEGPASRSVAAKWVPDAGAEQACLEFLADAPCRHHRHHRHHRADKPRGCSEGRAEDGRAPSVSPGGACSRWDECIDGFCTAQVGCRGTCKARSQLGGPCGSDQICGEDAYCWEGRCEPRAGVGAACGGHWQWCRDGLFCDGYVPANDNDHAYTREVQGKCSAGKLLGEGCVPPRTTIDDVCARGMFCDWGSDEPVCRVPGRAGDECRWEGACADGLLCVGLILGGYHPAGQRYATRQAGRCGPSLDAGDACDPRAFVSGCPTAMTCDEQRRVCRSTGHAGDPCTSSWVTGQHPQDVPLRTDGCFSSHYCDVKTRTCRPQRAPGESCTPQKAGVEDDPCFLGECHPKQRRCVVACE